MIITSCDNISDSDVFKNVINVPLKLTIEGVNVTESNLTRSTSYIPLYGIVATEEINGVKSNYAVGIFDNIADISIDLNKNNLYSFSVVMLNSNRCVNPPFDSEDVTNSFLYSDMMQSDLIDKLDLLNGATSPTTLKLWDMYYGTTNSVNPSNTPIAINVIRTGFGIDLSTEYIPEGEIILTIEGYHQTITDSDTSSSFYRFADYQNCYLAPNTYSETYNVKTQWKKEDNTIVDIDERLVEFKRNKLITFNVVLPTGTQCGISLSVEQDALADGGIIDITAGGSSSTSSTYVLNGVEYPMPEEVDLGLTSGTIWANMNLGASNEYDDGIATGYLGWLHENYTGYGGEDYYVYESPIEGEWTMPSQGHFSELFRECQYEYNNGGFLFTGNNGKSIFIPKRTYYTNLIDSYAVGDHVTAHSAWLYHFDEDVNGCFADPYDFASAVNFAKTRLVKKRDQGMHQ